MSSSAQPSLFECWICTTIFNESINKPLITPCGHVFCQECLCKVTTCDELDQPDAPILEYVEGKQYQLKCPQCQKLHDTHPTKLACVYSILAHMPNTQQNFMTTTQVNIHNMDQQLLPQPDGQLYSQRSNATTSHQSKSKRGNYQTTEHHSKPRANYCIRHPEKKVKYFCESDVQFLCSKCVLQHTGGGHLVTECRLDMGRVRSDFQDVKTKFQTLLDEAEQTKESLDQADKQLDKMCEKQSNNIQMVFKAFMRMIESKKREFLAQIHNYYGEQRERFFMDKQKIQGFLQKVKSSHHDELLKLEQTLEQTHYEELFKMLSTKSQDLSQLKQELHLHSKANSLPQMMYAVYIDKLKIAELGNIQYINASEYLQNNKHLNQHHQPHQGLHTDTSKSPRHNYKQHNTKSKLILEEAQSQFNIKQKESEQQKQLRAKQWALDDKTTKKLDNIIQRIGGNGQQEADNSGAQQQLSKMTKQVSDEANVHAKVNNQVLSSTTSITSCLFHKNLLQDASKSDNNLGSNQAAINSKRMMDQNFVQQQQTHQRNPQVIIPTLRTDLIGKTQQQQQKQPIGALTQIISDTESMLQYYQGSQTQRGNTIPTVQQQYQQQPLMSQRAGNIGIPLQERHLFLQDTIEVDNIPEPPPCKPVIEGTPNPLMNASLDTTTLNPFENGMYRPSITTSEDQRIESAYQSSQPIIMTSSNQQVNKFDKSMPNSRQNEVLQIHQVYNQQAKSQERCAPSTKHLKNANKTPNALHSHNTNNTRYYHVQSDMNLQYNHPQKTPKNYQLIISGQEQIEQQQPAAEEHKKLNSKTKQQRRIHHNERYAAATSNNTSLISCVVPPVMNQGPHTTMADQHHQSNKQHQRKGSTSHVNDENQLQLGKVKSNNHPGKDRYQQYSHRGEQSHRDKSGHQ